MSYRGWTFIWALLLIATALVATVFSSLASVQPGWVIFGLLVFSVTLTQLFQVNGPNGHSYSPDSVFFIAGVFLLLPGQFALLVITPHRIELLQPRLLKSNK